MLIYIHIVYYYQLFRRFTDSDQIYGIYILNFTNCISILLGNENIYTLVRGNNYLLRIDLEAVDGDQSYAKYYTFTIAGITDRYRLNVGQYCGDAGKQLKRKTNKCCTFTIADEIDRYRLNNEEHCGNAGKQLK